MAPVLIVILVVVVVVVAPVTVAALVNGNDAVEVIDIVDDQGSTSFVSIATMRSSNSMPRSRSEAIIAEPLAIVYCFALPAAVVRPQRSAMFCVLVHGVDHGHGIVPVHERGHDHGRDHVHGLATRMPVRCLALRFSARRGSRRARACA